MRVIIRLRYTDESVMPIWVEELMFAFIVVGFAVLAFYS